MTENITQVESGLMIFNQYEFVKRFAPEDKIRIVEEAIELGAVRADKIKSEYGAKKPEQILALFGVRIKTETNSSFVGADYVRFAEYHVKSGTIYLNSEALYKLDKKIQPGLARDIILCHELYHFFEMKEWGRTSELFVRTIKLFGKLPVKRKILPAAEVAADSFAKRYLDLDFNPQIIESYYFE